MNPYLRRAIIRTLALLTTCATCLPTASCTNAEENAADMLGLKDMGKVKRKPETLKPSPAPSASSVVPTLELREEDFIETDTSRDPFRSFSKTFAQQDVSVGRAQRTVMLDSYSLDELKLVGVVTGTAQARAMLVDPTGTGWIVTRGQYIGKPEIVSGAMPGSPSYEVNWRVDAIRPSDIVLVRQDPTEQGAPQATRIIALHPDEEPKSR